MKYTVIAPAGDNIDVLFIGIRDFPTEKVILLTPSKYNSEATRASKKLDMFKIPVQIVEIKGNIWEEMFRKISELKEVYKGKEIIVNTATGDRSTTCAATSAAFVNGLKAMSVEGNESMLLPVLKFSYYRLLSPAKMKILQALKLEATSLDVLAKKISISPPLLSYHIHGNLKSEGLVSLGLVDAYEKEGHMVAALTMLGGLLLKGYVKSGGN